MLLRRVGDRHPARVILANRVEYPIEGRVDDRIANLQNVRPGDADPDDREPQRASLQTLASPAPPLILASMRASRRSSSERADVGLGLAGQGPVIRRV